MSQSGEFVVMDNNSDTQAVQIRDRNLTLLRTLSYTQAHADLGYDAAGNEAYVSACHIRMARLDTGAVTNMVGEPSPYYICGHISTRGYKRPGWGLESYGNEIFAFKLDNSSIVERFAQTRTTGAYDSSPKGVISPDGSKVMWNSDWGSGSIYAYVAEMPGNSGSPDAEAPSIPAGLTATAVSASQINLSWTASTDNVGVTGYKIFRSGLQIATSAGAGYSATGLSASTLYSFIVAAYDAAGNTSAQSAPASAATLAVPPASLPPAKPTGLSLR